MNINDEMVHLGTYGSTTYAPSDALIGDLIGKAKRARAARTGAVTAATTVGLAALGLSTASAVNAIQNDPAFRDRNVSNNTSGLTPIEQFKAQYGNDVPTKINTSTVDIAAIVAQLKAAAQTNPTLPSTTTVPPATNPKPSGGTKPSGGGGSSTPPAYSCEGAPANYEGATWNCTSKEWDVATGYFMFGNTHVYKHVTWTDDATNQTRTGNWSGTGWGWDTKAIITSGSGTGYITYVYMGSNATWANNTCIGTTKTKWNAPMQASCLPTSDFNFADPNYREHGGIVWVLQDSNYKWFDCEGVYYHISSPPAGWTWDGTQWVEVSTPAP